MDLIEASDYRSSMHDRLSHIHRDLLKVSDLTVGSMNLMGSALRPDLDTRPDQLKAVDHDVLAGHQARIDHAHPRVAEGCLDRDNLRVVVLGHGVDERASFGAEYGHFGHDQRVSGFRRW